MPNSSMFHLNENNRLKILRYGETTASSDLPACLSEIIRSHSVYREIPWQQWRRLPLGNQAYWLSSHEVIVPISLIFSMNLSSPSENTLNKGFGCQMKCAMLTRLFDNDQPTRYFAGQSTDTGEVYWAEESINDGIIPSRPKNPHRREAKR